MNTKLRGSLSIVVLFTKELLPPPDPKSFGTFLKIVYYILYMYVSIAYLAVFYKYKFIAIADSCTTREGFKLIESPEFFQP